MEPQKRLQSLDVLRACAVFLVLMHHLGEPPTTWPGPLAAIVNTIIRGGWIGVDLFFVLSGFLVSGLLFRDHIQHGELRISRFLGRRALKIYPAFYAMIGVTLILRWHQLPIDKTAVLSELLFVQNYFSHLWGHTWSLAVEEHFYLILPLVLAGLAYCSGYGKNPFKRIPDLCIWLAVAMLSLRCLEATRSEYDAMSHLFPTHLRLDSLMFGVFISYLAHYHSEKFYGICSRYSKQLAVIGLLCVAPAFIFELQVTPFIYTFGLTLFCIGNGLILASTLGPRFPDNAFTRFVAWIGTNSYSIYLWHGLVKQVSTQLTTQLRLADMGSSLVFAIGSTIFLVGSVVIGMVLAQVVEWPMLRVRERLIPSQGGTRKEVVRVERRSAPRIARQGLSGGFPAVFGGAVRA